MPPSRLETLRHRLLRDAQLLGGFILALALRAGREKIDTSGPELLGAVPYKPDDLPAKKDIEVGYALGMVKLSGDLSFMNIAKAQEEIEAAAAGNEALILKLSKLDTIDTTAADKLDETLDSLMARGVHVKLVRPIKETSDHYTRYELRRLMQDFKFYPSVRTAIHSLAEEYAAGMEPQRPDTWLADAPAPRLPVRRRLFGRGRARAGRRERALLLEAAFVGRGDRRGGARLPRRRHAHLPRRGGGRGPHGAHRPHHPRVRPGAVSAVPKRAVGMLPGVPSVRSRVRASGYSSSSRSSWRRRSMALWKVAANRPKAKKNARVK